MQVHVLGVPGKCGLPTAKVEVGRVHSVDLDAIIFLNVIEDRVEPVDVPTATCGVSDAPFKVGSIQWRHKCNVLPIFPLKVLKTALFKNNKNIRLR